MSFEENLDNKNDIVSLNKIDEMMNEYFGKISQLDKENIITSPHCKLCLHPARSEAEKRFEETGSFVSVTRFLEDYRKKNPECNLIGSQCVKNHITEHYQQQIKRAWIREYADRLKSFLNKKISDDFKLELNSSQLQLQLIEIASDPTIDPIRKADAMSKLVKTIADIMLLQSRLKGELQSVHVVYEKFASVWVDVIQNQSDPHVKKAMIEGLNTFGEKIEGLPLNPEEDNE